MTIYKKILPEYFEAVQAGRKNFELRLADFDANEDDTLVLQEWNPVTKAYTGREIEKTISYVIKTKDLHFWNDEEVAKYGYQIISFK